MFKVHFVGEARRAPPNRPGGATVVRLDRRHRVALAAPAACFAGRVVPGAWLLTPEDADGQRCDGRGRLVVPAGVRRLVGLDGNVLLSAGPGLVVVRSAAVLDTLGVRAVGR